MPRSARCFPSFPSNHCPCDRYCKVTPALGSSRSHVFPSQVLPHLSSPSKHYRSDRYCEVTPALSLSQSHVVPPQTLPHLDHCCCDRYCEVTPALGPSRTRVRHQKAAVPGAVAGSTNFPSWVDQAAGSSRNAVFVDQVWGVGRRWSVRGLRVEQTSREHPGPGRRSS